MFIWHISPFVFVSFLHVTPAIFSKENGAATVSKDDSYISPKQTPSPVKCVVPYTFCIKNSKFNL